MAFDDDSRLARKAQRGDRQAFEIILTRYQRPIFSFIYHFGKYPFLGHHTVPGLVVNGTALMALFSNLTDAQEDRTPDTNFCPDGEMNEIDAFRSNIFCKISIAYV